MTPEEVEFLGEKKLVSIIPKFNFDRIHLFSGSIGPFKAGLVMKVPIWVALGLKQQQKCQIIPQDWMTDEIINEYKDTEKGQPLFTEMPSDHFIEEAKMLLSAAADDIPDADNIRTAIKDLWDLRQAKLRTSMIDFVKTQGRYAKLDHLTAMEINSIRSYLPEVLNVIHRMEQKIKEDAAANAEASTSMINV